MQRVDAVAPPWATLVFAAVAGFWAPAALAQSANPAWLRPGTVFLALSTDAPSSMQLDLEVLEPLGCVEGESGLQPRRSQSRTSQPRMGGGSEECRLVVGNGGNGGTLPDSGPPTDLRLQVLQIVSDRSGCGTLVEVRPIGLSLWGEERLNLACGLKAFSIGLDSGASQPTSWLHLPAGDPLAATGWFMGTLAMVAEVRIDGTGLPMAPRISLPQNLEISGRWTALDASSIPNLPASQSTLVLLTEKMGSQWVGKISCGQERARCGRLCFEAAGTPLGWLNGSGVVE